MLILQRRAGESLLIGKDISVTVLSVDNKGRVRLAITAPAQVPILRDELVTAAETNRDSASAEPSPEALAQLLGGAPAPGRPAPVAPVPHRPPVGKKEQKKEETSWN